VYPEDRKSSSCRSTIQPSRCVERSHGIRASLLLCSVVEGGKQVHFRALLERKDLSNVVLQSGQPAEEKMRDTDAGERWWTHDTNVRSEGQHIPYDKSLRSQRPLPHRSHSGRRQGEEKTAGRPLRTDMRGESETTKTQTNPRPEVPACVVSPGCCPWNGSL